MSRLKFIVGFFIWVGCTSAWAQSTCEDQLNAAAEEYAAGRFYGIPAMLKPCLDKGFSREQKQRAYLLLTQTYLLLEDPIAAEDSYLKVLQANPEFTTDPERDPIDLVYLSRKFTASPIFSLYGKLGPSVTVARIIDDVDLVSSTQSTKEKYLLRPTLHAEVGVDWHFYPRLSLSGALNYSSNSFKFEEKGKYGRDLEEMIERQSWVSIPLSLKYTMDVGKFRPYGFLGYSVNLLLSDNAQFKIYNKEGSGVSKNAESPKVDFLSKRNILNRSFFLGGGVMLKKGLDFFFIETRYYFGLSNVVNTEKLYSDGSNGTPEDVFPYGHIDNYFRVDNLSLSIGYVRPLYKPRKLKNARTNGLLRLIKRKSDASK